MPRRWDGHERLIFAVLTAYLTTIPAMLNITAACRREWKGGKDRFWVEVPRLLAYTHTNTNTHTQTQRERERDIYIYISISVAGGEAVLGTDFRS